MPGRLLEGLQCWKTTGWVLVMTLQGLFQVSHGIRVAQQAAKPTVASTRSREDSCHQHFRNKPWLWAFFVRFTSENQTWHHPKPSSRLAPAAGQRMCQPCGILVCWDPLGEAGSDLFSPAVARYPLHCFPSAAGRPAEGSEPRQGTELSPAHAKLPARGCSKQNLLKGHLFGLPLQLPEETAIIFQPFKTPGSNVLGHSFPTCSWFVRRLLRSHFLAKKSFSFLLNPG